MVIIHLPVSYLACLYSNCIACFSTSLIARISFDDQIDGKRRHRSRAIRCPFASLDPVVDTPSFGIKSVLEQSEPSGIPRLAFRTLKRQVA